MKKVCVITNVNNELWHETPADALESLKCVLDSMSEDFKEVSTEDLTEPSTIDSFTVETRIVTDQEYLEKMSTEFDSF